MFIIKRSEAMVFDLHRLVHLATRSWLQKEGLLPKWSKAAIGRLDDLSPNDEHQNRNQWRILLLHVVYALRLDITAQDNSQRLDLLWKYGNGIHSDARYREAEVPFEEIFQTRRRIHGEEHPDTLTSMANMAST